MNIINVTQIIDLLGGSLSVAVLANVHQVTVERWRKRNVIPRKYHRIILAAAAKKGVSIV